MARLDLAGLSLAVDLLDAADETAVMTLDTANLLHRLGRLGSIGPPHPLYRLDRLDLLDAFDAGWPLRTLYADGMFSIVRTLHLFNAYGSLGTLRMLGAVRTLRMIVGRIVAALGVRAAAPAYAAVLG